MNNIFYKIFNIADADGKFLDATLPIVFYLMDRGTSTRKKIRKNRF